MIGKLKGIVDSTGEDWVVVDVGGVGYHVTCSRRTLSALPAQGNPVTLSIETKMSEEAIRLIGFSSDGGNGFVSCLAYRVSAHVLRLAFSAR